MTHTNTISLRFRQSRAILIALAQGSLPWAALSTVFFCAMLFLLHYILNAGYLSREAVQMNLSFLPPFMFFIGACGVMVALIFNHSALDELRSQFPTYEILFPIPVGLTVTLHLVYKLLVWNVAFSLLYLVTMFVVKSNIHNIWETFDYGDGIHASLVATLLFLMFQQIAWLQHNTYRIFWIFFNVAVLFLWHATMNLNVMLFQLCYLLFLCYAQVYLQRRGGFSFDIADALSRISLDTGKVKKRTPLWTLVDVQWKAWYQWIFAFNLVLCILVVRTYGISDAIAVSAVVFIFAGYLTERRDSNSMYCCTRPVTDRYLLRARIINALRCAFFTLLLFLVLDTMIDWMRMVSGTEYVYYSSDQMKLRYLYQSFMNTDAKAAIIILYASMYALSLAALWFALVAGRYLILLGVFVGLASLVASVVFAPVAIYLNTFNLDIPLLILLYTLQGMVAVLALLDIDMRMLRRFTKKDWIAKIISAGLIASFGVLGIIVFQNYALVAFFGSFVMLALLAAKQMGTLEKRDYILLAIAGGIAVLAPLPVVLSFTDELARDWVAWSVVLFSGLAVAMLCVPITVRWQRVSG